jgi:Domain of unknown function (DUF4864)
MIRSLLAVIAVVFVATFARAESLSPTEKQAVTTVIETQLRAFAADDGPAAYAEAAPIVTGVFKSVEQFMAMVKQGYQPVYRNRGYEFTDSYTDDLGRPTQKVVLRGMDGKSYEAHYFMEKQPDGSWKIAGCVITVIPGQEV